MLMMSDFGFETTTAAKRYPQRPSTTTTDLSSIDSGLNQVANIFENSVEAVIAIGAGIVILLFISVIVICYWYVLFELCINCFVLRG